MQDAKRLAPANPRPELTCFGVPSNRGFDVRRDGPVRPFRPLAEQAAPDLVEQRLPFFVSRDTRSENIASHCSPSLSHHSANHFTL